MSSCDAKGKSVVEIMWTNQHGTGPKTDDRVETQVILQYMCQAYPEGKMATDDVNNEFEYNTIRNGQTLNTQGFTSGARENAYIKKTEDFTSQLIIIIRRISAEKETKVGRLKINQYTEL